MNYTYHLAKWNERDKTIVCPGCGRGHGCFKEYVDDAGNPVDTELHRVGKCDHENSCGYHLTPGEWMKQGGKVSHAAVKIELPKPKFIEIDKKLVGKFHKCTKQVGNNLVSWLRSLPLTDEQQKSIDYMIGFYAMGTTKDGRVIWWQIDENRVVRTGKIMRFGDNGHRVKSEEGNSKGMSWVHSMLRSKFGMYPESEGWQVNQCLFGQHLLNLFGTDQEIHIVEGEKTAFIMSLLDPDSITKHLWMAAGGKKNLNASRLIPLKGRKIYCYPDADGVEDWKAAIRGTGARMATTWMNELTTEDGQKADIADVLIRKLTTTKETEKPATQVKECIENPLMNHPLVKLMTEQLDLYPI